jgi:steroid 5-alpha reductase family enzyme
MVSLGRVVAPAPVNLPSVRYAALLLRLIYTWSVCTSFHMLFRSENHGNDPNIPLVPK